MTTLHILNGDSTLWGFEQTGLDGDIMVWREIFSQGPLEENISSAHFWRKREEWIAETFREKPESYQHKILDQLRKLNEQYDEINLWFEFEDNGIGIPEESLPHIFDPFFTTKGVGQGMGMGLSIAFGIMELHKGAISVKSTVGQGTCFMLRLPLPDGVAVES